MAKGAIIARGNPNEIIAKFKVKGLHEVITLIAKEQDV